MFSSNVFCSRGSVRGMGFRGVINVILRKQIGMSRSFFLFHPLHTQQVEDVHAPFVFKFFLFVLMTLIVWGGALRDDTKNGCEGD